MGCTFPLSRSTLSAACDSLRKGSLSLLLGTASLKELGRLRVGAFGSADPDDPTAEWVPVLVENPPLSDGVGVGGDGGNGDEVGSPSYPSSSPGVCRDMVLSAHTEVVYAMVGAAANPQAKVVGVRVRFGSPRDVGFSCLGSACGDPDRELQVEVASSLSFVDVTRPALQELAEFPVIEAKLPYDFFYPFVDDHSTVRLNGAGSVKLATPHLAAAVANVIWFLSARL